MQDERSLNAEDREAAELLGSLRPSRPGLSRDAVLLETYRRAARRQAWLWRGVAAALAAGLVLSVALRPQPKTVQTVVYVPIAPAAVAPQIASAAPPHLDELPPASQQYLALRHDVLAWGMAALPRTAAAPATAAPTPPPPLIAPEQSPMLYDLLKGFGIGGRS